MKFNFNSNEKCNIGDARRLHKNLFLDEFSRLDDDEDFSNYQYTDEYESDYDEKIEKKSQYYKLNEFSMPLTGNYKQIILSNGF